MMDMEDGISDVVLVLRDIGKVKKELSTLQSKVDTLQNKVHWYESTARWLFFIGLNLIFLTNGPKQGQAAKHGPAVGEVKYGLLHSDNSRYEGRSTWGGDGFWVRNGFGTEVFTEKNAVKEGFYKNDQLDGFGREAIDGTFLEGQYKYDKLNGYGVYIDDNGNIYRGQWKNDKKSGYGTLIKFSNNRTYEGYWENNTLREDRIVRSRSLESYDDDTNTTTTRNQSLLQPEYIGTMNKQYLFHGKGIMVWPDTGIRFEAIWENGKPIGKIVVNEGGGKRAGKQQEEEEEENDHDNKNDEEGMFIIPVVRHVPGSLEDYNNVVKMMVNQQHYQDDDDDEEGEEKKEKETQTQTKVGIVQDPVMKNGNNLEGDTNSNQTKVASTDINIA